MRPVFWTEQIRIDDKEKDVENKEYTKKNQDRVVERREEKQRWCPKFLIKNMVPDNQDDFSYTNTKGPTDKRGEKKGKKVSFDQTVPGCSPITKKNIFPFVLCVKGKTKDNKKDKKNHS